MKKKSLELLITLLSETELNLADARIRDGFLKDVVTHLNTYQQDRKKVIETYCDKDDKGNPIVKGNLYTFKDSTEVTKELDTLLNEEVDIKTPPQIKTFIEKTTYKPKAGETLLIDELISAL